jgi:hypothetical protein
MTKRLNMVYGQAWKDAQPNSTSENQGIKSHGRGKQERGGWILMPPFPRDHSYSRTPHNRGPRYGKGFRCIRVKKLPDLRG